MYNGIYIFYKRFSNLIIKSSKYIIICSIFIILFSSYYKFKLSNIIKYFHSRNKIIESNTKVCICSLGKKENKYIKEYVEHYISLGVDKIYLYDNNDIGDEKFEDVLSDYVKNDLVQIINYRGKIAPQLKIYEKCYNLNKIKYDWLIFFDIDEFIHLNNFNSIKEFLNQKKFKDCKLIYFNCVRHTDNDLLYYDNRSLAERFPIILWNSTMYTLKTIIRGKIKKDIRFRTTHWLNRGLRGGCNVFGESVIPTRKVRLGYKINHQKFKRYYIDHYCFKSTEEYINKINKGDGIFGNNSRTKFHKINLYFGYNKITAEKINYIENKTGLKLNKFKLMLKK